MSFLLAHLSDPHLAPLPRPQWRDLASKRALGYLNWRRGRDAIHRADVLLALVDDLLAQRPDHIAVTGDLTNLALDGEFAAAAAWLHRLGDHNRVTVIPGNHDAYVEGALERGLAIWSPWLGSDGREHAHVAPHDVFPLFRRRGPIALIGVSTAVPTGAFRGSGQVGARQLEKLGDLLVHSGRDSAFRVVLVHHPLVVERRHWSNRLVDAGALKSTLVERGAELVLHGHMHVPSEHMITGHHGAVPVIGVPSASADPVRAKAPAGYALLRIETSANGWSVKMERRGFVAPGRIGTQDSKSFVINRSRA